MKTCYICKKKIGNIREDICSTCFELLKQKYGKKFRKHLERLRKYFENESDSIKFRRAK